MALNKGKHITKEIDGVYCTVVESGINTFRLQFLKELLEFNQFIVKIAEEPAIEDEKATFIIGVTNLVFNPVIAVYEKSLKRPDAKEMTAIYWNQQEEIEYLPYFDYRSKNHKAKNDDDFLPNPWAYRTL